MDANATPSEITIQQNPVMQDFVFGGIEADGVQLVQTERSLHRSIRHRHAIAPLDPLPGEPVVLTVYVGPDVHVDRVTAYVTVNGDEPSGARGVAQKGHAVAFTQVDIQWEPLLWDYVELWQAELSPQATNTLVQYRIEGWRTYDEEYSVWSSEPNMDGTVERPARYAYHVDTFAPPAWAHEAVLYQIFVDRFAIPERVEEPYCWLAPEELNDFAGGTLAGITERLDYLADLGVTALWLTPIFQTPTYHGYDTTDYYRVEPRFGTNDDLRRLVEAAHSRGLRVILDFVANHTSTDFAPFAKAIADEKSPYCDWFSFNPSYKNGYRAFFDVPSMPQLDTDRSAVRRYLCEAAAFWLQEYHIDGYRLDYAAGPSHAFWSEFRTACKTVNPDCWLFGEVTQPGTQLRTYTGRLDGGLDFSFARTIRRLCGPQTSISIAEFASTIERGHRFFAGTNFNVNERTFMLPAFLDNHDMNRFSWVVDDNAARVKLAATLLFGLCGPPIIYYGTEVGLSQPRAKGYYREEARHTMRWGAAQDKEMQKFFKKLIAIRRGHPALWRGDFSTRWLAEEQGLWVVERRHLADCALVAVNVGRQPQAVPLPPGRWQGLEQTIVAEAFSIAAESATILTLTDE